jgi:hypothetical protein
LAPPKPTGRNKGLPLCHSPATDKAGFVVQRSVFGGCKPAELIHASALRFNAVHSSSDPTDDWSVDLKNRATRSHQSRNCFMAND